MQSRCKDDRELPARMQAACKGAAIQMHSVGMDANTVQTECKYDAVGLLFGFASGTPSYL
jgi:hypothetical protein